MGFQRKKPAEPLTYPMALDVGRAYCAHAERAPSEVRTRLISTGLKISEVDKAMAQLTEEGYVSEERYATALAGGKFRQQGWGPKKIEQRLKEKRIAPNLIEEAVGQLEKTDIDATLEKLLRKKVGQVGSLKLTNERAKVVRYGLSKGFDAQRIFALIKVLAAEEANGGPIVDEVDDMDDSASAQLGEVGEGR